MKKMRSILIILFLAAFIGSTGMIGLQVHQMSLSAESDRAAFTLAKPLPPAAEAPAIPPQIATTAVFRQDLPLSDSIAEELLAIDLNALQEENPDVLGWFLIPGTNISYPLMQGEDNDYYLNYTWDRQASYRGSVFMECRSDANLLDFNTIIYGHNLLDGTMFSQLHKYKDEDFLREYPYVYIVNENGAYRYRIFAAFEVPTTASAYRLRFTQEQKHAFLQDSLAQSIHDTGIVPTEEDQILTLSTCTGVIRTNRWVVQAVLEGQVVSPGEYRQLIVDSSSALYFE